MDRARFRDWVSSIDELTAAQRREAAAVLSDPPEGEASLAAIELGTGEERRCPHCDSGGAVSRGKSRGLRRYRCKSCGRTFGTLTGTALSGLHRKEQWLSFAASLAEGETIRGAAVRAAGLRRARRSAGATASWRRFGSRRTGSPGSSRPTKPSRSKAARASGAVHIQTVNSRHSQIKGFLRRFRGIATKCLDSYLRWFHLVVLGRHPSPRACLAAASARSCLRFAN